MASRAIITVLLAASPLGIASSLIPQLPGLNSLNSLNSLNPVNSLGLPGMNLNALNNFDLAQITSGGLGGLTRSVESLVPELPVIGSLSLNGDNSQSSSLSPLNALNAPLSPLNALNAPLSPLNALTDIASVQGLTRSADTLQIPGLNEMASLASQLATLPSFAAAETDLLRELSTSQPQVVTKIVQDIAKNIPGISALNESDASVFTDLMKDVVVVPASLGVDTLSPVRAIGEATKFLGLN